MYKMQSILSISRKLMKLNLNVNIEKPRLFSTLQDISMKKILQVYNPVINPICGFKVKGRVRRRCKSCYFVFRDQRKYVICPEHPRHKQMAMKPKPHNTWILTHASQSPVRPW
ncbi:unnamed protein product [Parnassius mnemosyne]|uniref:Ribosomal protein n=2 Tax=Parnassius mnemosyne TaxID=213953 RepID=A0AAV1KWF3_9NEOP